MADTRKITIEIISKGSGTGGSAADGKGNDGAENGLVTNINYLIHPIKSAEKALFGKNVLINQAYQLAKQAIVRSIDISINRYFEMSENYKGEQDWQNTKAKISKITSFATSVGAGAIAGAKLGGYGALAGALIGAMGYSITETIQWDETVRKYRQSLDASRINREYYGVRYGLVDGSHGTEN